MTGRAIAIDGPAASGKSTTAHAVADRLGFAHLNSGRLYRAIGWLADLQDRAPGDSDFEAWVEGLHIGLRGEPPDLVVTIDGATPGTALDEPEVAVAASVVARNAAVRGRVLEILRGASAQYDIVCDGRDIGTSVFPEAPLKVFLVASAAERARRRLLDQGEEPTRERLEGASARLRQRDLADETRELSPLRRASDAIEIDTTTMPADEVVDQIVELAAERGIAGAGADREGGKPPDFVS